MVTAPSACWASLPVSNVMVRPPTSAATVCTVGYAIRLFFSPAHIAPLMSLRETLCLTLPEGRETQGLEDGYDRPAAHIHAPIPKAPCGHAPVTSSAPP